MANLLIPAEIIITIDLNSLIYSSVIFMYLYHENLPQSITPEEPILRKVSITIYIQCNQLEFLRSLSFDLYCLK